MPDLAPEAKAREQIDAQLTAAGWVLQDYDRYDPSVARGIALREIPVTGGRCDYMLLVDRSPVGVIEAKKVGTMLAAVAEQSAYYGANLPDFLKGSIGILPFCYESTGVETFFRDERDPDPRSRQNLLVSPARDTCRLAERTRYVARPLDPHASTRHDRHAWLPGGGHHQP